MVGKVVASGCNKRFLRALISAKISSTLFIFGLLLLPSTGGSSVSSSCSTLFKVVVLGIEKAMLLVKTEEDVGDATSSETETRIK